MDFFEPIPEMPDVHQPPTVRMPPWMGVTENVLPVPVATQVELARTADHAIVLRSVLAYREGWSFDLHVLSREPDYHGGVMQALYGMPAHPGMPTSGAGPFRFGVRFADGSKAIAGAHMHVMVESESDDPRQPPKEPVLMPMGGGGGGRSQSISFWCWPLPPEGDLTAVVEWPGQGIALTEVSLDGAAIRDAATRAEELWSDDHLPEWGADFGQHMGQDRTGYSGFGGPIDVTIG